MIEEKWPRRMMEPEEIRHYNNEIVYQISQFLNLAPKAVNLEEVKQISKSCDVSMDYAYAAYLAALVGLDTDGRDRDFFRNYYLPMIHCLDVSDYRKNPYYQSIHIEPRKLGKWDLRMQTLEPGEGFICQDFRVFPDGRLVPQVGFFTEPFPYPAVLENGREWMTLMPNETVTTDPSVALAHGHVLTFGLGLGYFVFQALNNPRVKDVTVVELSADVIQLFKEQILPQFPYPKRVKIIQMDAFSFADEKMQDGQYDFVFADIWHDVGDGRELYLRMKQYESKFPHTQFTFWLEESIQCYLRENLWPNPKEDI